MAATAPASGGDNTDQRQQTAKQGSRMGGGDGRVAQWPHTTRTQALGAGGGTLAAHRAHTGAGCQACMAQWLSTRRARESHTHEHLVPCMCTAVACTVAMRAGSHVAAAMTGDLR